MAYKDWLVELRNEFHRHPELSGSETRTTRRICEILGDLGIETAAFDGLTGAVGLIRGKGQGDGPTLALRADIDALPLSESGGKPYQSENPGIMHACGHDANTAILLGVARKITDTSLGDRISGNIKLIFQPSEETLGGALALIEKGVLDAPGVDRIIAGHMDPMLAVGTVGVFDRIGHAASDSFKLTITGRGTHGARPHLGINPIAAGGMFAAGLDSLVQRNASPAQTAVVSVGSFHAGDAGNVIPETAVLRGTLRTHEPHVREKMIRALEGLTAGMDAVYGTASRFDFREGAPLGLNDPAVSQDLKTASIQVLGEEKVRVLPFIMGGDDFYYFTRECPGAMMRFGCADKESGTAAPLHSPDFDIHEAVLPLGVEILFRAVENFFASR